MRLAGTDLVASVMDVVRPSHGQTRIDGLRIHDSWSCTVDRCATLSANRDVIRRHCSRTHPQNPSVSNVRQYPSAVASARQCLQVSRGGRRERGQETRREPISSVGGQAENVVH